MIIVAVDPGMSTGIARMEMDDEGNMQGWVTAQIEGGLNGLLDSPWAQTICEAEKVVFEVFTPRPMSRNYRSDELEPLRIEGAVRMLRLGLNDQTIFQRPEARSILRLEPMSESVNFLKYMGMHSTGKSVGKKDANDANAAMLHLVAYLRDTHNRDILARIENALEDKLTGEVPVD